MLAALRREIICAEIYARTAAGGQKRENHSPQRALGTSAGLRFRNSSSCSPLTIPLQAPKSVQLAGGFGVRLAPESVFGLERNTQSSSEVGGEAMTDRASTA